jgi:hypothetical protein
VPESISNLEGDDYGLVSPWAWSLWCRLPHQLDNRAGAAGVYAYPAVAVAQNAVAAVAYALEAAELAQVQSAVWAARQLYEAADAVVQQASEAHTYIEDIEAHPAARLAVDGIVATLDSLESESVSSILDAARVDGRAFSKLMAGQEGFVGK